MRTIFKYGIDMPGANNAAIPEGGRLLHVGIDPAHGNVCAWIEVDDSAPTTPAVFFVFGTGHQIPDGVGDYAGTVVQPPFVWHVYWKMMP